MKILILGDIMGPSGMRAIKERLPELIKDKPTNRIDLFFEYSKDMNERILTIKTSGRLKVNEFWKKTITN